MNKNTKRLKSMSRLTGRYETGGIRKVVLDAPSPYSPSGGSKYFKATAATDLEYEWVNGRGYTDRRDDNVIGSSHRHQRSTGGDIEYVLIAGGGGGRHGGGGAGGVFGNGPLTPSPLRNTADFGPGQFTGYSNHNTVGPVSKNMSGGVVGIVSAISDSLSIGAKGSSGASGSDSTFHSRTANGGGRGGSSGNSGTPGGSGGGAGRGPASGGTGSQGGNGGSAFNPKPAGWSAGGGGGAGGNSSNPTSGPGITILVPGSPENVCGGGAGGAGAPGPSYCSGNQRPDGYCYGSFVPGAASPACPANPTGGGGGTSQQAAGLGAGGGGNPQPQSATTNGGDGVAYFRISENILK